MSNEKFAKINQLSERSKTYLILKSVEDSIVIHGIYNSHNDAIREFKELTPYEDFILVETMPNRVRG